MATLLSIGALGVVVVPDAAVRHAGDLVETPLDRNERPIARPADAPLGSNAPLGAARPTFVPHTPTSILDSLRRYNRSQAAPAEALCADEIGHATPGAMHAAFASAAPHAPSPRTHPRGCYFLCIAGSSARLLPTALGKLPWDGKCFQGNGSLINQFGHAGHACAARVEALRATYAPGPSRADPAGGDAIVIEYHGAVAAMRDEYADAERTRLGSLSIFNVPWLCVLSLVDDPAFVPSPCTGFAMRATRQVTRRCGTRGWASFISRR